MFAEPLRADDAKAIAALRGVLDRAGFTVDGVSDALALEDGSQGGPDEAPFLLRLLPEDQPLSTLIKLFRLGVAVGRTDAESALGPVPLERLAATGLVTLHAGVVQAPVSLLPFDDLLIVADRRERRPHRPDHVLDVTPPSLLLARVTSRTPVESVLDIGTGCGIQALLAAPHARRVVGVDVNPRALAFAKFNALLNDVENVEWRLGNLFEPVRGSRFDLIVCNPPYVVSPETRYAFRDSGLPGDAFCAALVREAPAFLNEGGFANLLVGWAHGRDEDWRTPLVRWVEGSGCDAVLLHCVSQEPLAYAAGWNRPLGLDGEEYEEALDRWSRYYDELGIEAIAFGFVILRRRSGANWVSTHSLAGEPVGPAGHHVARLFAAQDYLAVLDDERLLDQRYAPAPDHRLEQTLAFESGEALVREAFLRLEGGLGFRVSVDAPVVEVLSRLDGRRPLRGVLAEVAAAHVADGARRDRFCVSALAAVRRLLELGFVVPSGATAASGGALAREAGSAARSA